MTGVVSGGDLEELFDAGQQRFGLILDVVKEDCFDISVAQSFANSVKIAAVLTVPIHAGITQELLNLLFEG